MPEPIDTPHRPARPGEPTVGQTVLFQAPNGAVKRMTVRGCTESWIMGKGPSSLVGDGPEIGMGCRPADIIGIVE